MSDDATYVLERTFDASPALVWRAFTEKELLAHWYGPGVETVIHELDVTPGGRWLNEMRMQGNSMYQSATYTEVEPVTRLVWLHATTDADWNPIENPMMPGWPKELLTVVTLNANGEMTDMRLTWTPHEATPAEIDVFKGSMADLDRGWGTGMDMLAELLATLNTRLSSR